MTFEEKVDMAKQKLAIYKHLIIDGTDERNMKEWDDNIANALAIYIYGKGDD